jgi:hypothetical protein
VNNRIHTEKQLEFIKENAKGISQSELFERFKKMFPEALLTSEQIKSIKYYHGLKCELKSGCKKGYKFVNRKEHPNPYRRSEGSERIRRADGVVLIKIAQSWKPKHMIIWEKENKRLIPIGHCIIFADGNKNNLNIDNLILVDRHELCYMGIKGLFSTDSELTKIGKTIASIKMCIKNKHSRKI